MDKPIRSRRRPSPGFTLIELLVVIAVIGILAGLLLPALSKAKGQARKVQCLSSLRQLALAFEMYASDNGEMLAANGNSTTGTPRTWVGGDSHWFLPPFTNTAYLTDNRYALFASYVPAAAIYKCPEDKTILKRGPQAPAVPQIRTYSMNAFLGWDTSSEIQLTPGYRVFYKTGDFDAVSPASLFVFQEVHPNSICLPGFVTYMPGDQYDGFYHYPSSLHSGAGTMSFADGHVESHRWQDPRTRKPVNSGMLAHEDRSPNNPDVRWLRTHATHRPGETLADSGAIGAAGAGVVPTEY